MLLQYLRQRRRPASFVVTVIVLFSCTLFGCGGGGGGGGSSPEQPSDTVTLPDQTGVQIKPVTGTIQFPIGSPDLLSTCAVNTSFGASAASTNGSFNIPINALGVQLISVNNSHGDAELLGISGIESGQNSIQLTAHSTAVALVFLSPFLASDDPQSARQIGALIEGLPSLAPVEAAISRQVVSRGALDLTDQGLISAIEAAVQAAVSMLQSGGVPSAHQHDVSPTTQQSKLLIQTLSDNDPTNIALNVQNFGLRFVELWEQPVDSNGNAVGPESTLGLIPSADDFSIGSIPGAIVTGEVFGASHTPLSVSIPSGATAIQIRAWGPGANDLSSVTPSDFKAHASSAALTTAIINLAGPAIDAMVGVKVLTRGRGRPSDLFRLVENLLNTEEGKRIASEVNEHPVRASWDTLNFLLQNSEGQQFLFDLAKSAGISGVTKVLLKKAGVLLSVAAIGFDTYNGLSALGSIGAAKPLEVYTVAPGATNMGNIFTVTLTWDQADDIDVHTFAPDGSHSFFSNTQISSGYLDTDNITGFGPEHFTATSVLPGIYHIAVNYYNGSSLTNARIRVTTSQGDQDFGPYELTTADKDTDYPVASNTGSWWRPCDIRVSPNGSVEVLPPDRTISLDRLIPHGVSMQKH